MPSCLLPVKRCDAKKKQKKKNPTVTFLFTNDLELRILQGLYFKFNEKSLEYLLTPGVFARCRGSNLRSSPGAASPLYNIWVPLLVVLSFLALPHPPPPLYFSVTPSKLSKESAHFLCAEQSSPFCSASWKTQLQHHRPKKTRNETHPWAVAARKNHMKRPPL